MFTLVSVLPSFAQVWADRAVARAKAEAERGAEAAAAAAAAREAAAREAGLRGLEDRVRAQVEAGVVKVRENGWTG